MTEEDFPDALPPGHRLHWYVLERVLGQGGFGITYLAHDTNLDRRVAIKEYLPADVARRRSDASARPSTESHAERFAWGLDRFLSEARTLARFEHTNIVRVLSIFEANNTAYMVMRFEEGEDLGTLLRRRGTLPQRELVEVLLPVMAGLQLIHSSGFIHRDVKPENIYIRDDGTPVLLDFGSARQSFGSTKPLTILVAPGYAPLEQYYGDAKTQGPWTDIYGLAATAYRAVTGRAPLDAIARAKGVLGSTRDLLEPAVALAQGHYEGQLLKAIDHALQLSERDRPQSVAEWRREVVAPTIVPLGDPAADSLGHDARPSVIERPAALAAARPMDTATTLRAGHDEVAPRAAAPASLRSNLPFLSALAAALCVIAVGAFVALRPRPSSPEAVVASAPPPTRPVADTALPSPPETTAPIASRPAASAPAVASAIAPAVTPANTDSVAPPVVATAPAAIAAVAAPTPRDSSAGRTRTASRELLPAEARPSARDAGARDLAGTATRNVAVATLPTTAARTGVPAAVPVEARPSADPSSMRGGAVSSSSLSASPTPPPAVAAPSPVAAATAVATAQPSTVLPSRRRDDQLDAAESALRRGDAAVAAELASPWAAAGVARAQTLLGRAREARSKDQRSDLEAYVWYSIAARSGESGAAALRDKVAGRLQPAEIRQAEQMIERFRPRAEGSTDSATERSTP